MRIPPSLRSKVTRDSKCSVVYAADMSLGARIRAAREAAGLSLAAVGAHVGKSKVSVWCWEQDQARPGIDDRIDIARLLNVPFSELLPEAEPEDGEVVVLTDPSIRQIVRLWPNITPALREVLLMACAKLAVPEPAAAEDVPTEPSRRRTG